MRFRSAWWFLLILAFLVHPAFLLRCRVSRHAPKHLADIRSYCEESPRAKPQTRLFHHRAEAGVAGSTEAALSASASNWCLAAGRSKMQQYDTVAGPYQLDGSHKAGAGQQAGYGIAAHCAIVLICIGGLFDGDPSRAQMLLGGKRHTGGGMISDVAPEHRLVDQEPDPFRGNSWCPKARVRYCDPESSDGILLQDLPFSVELERTSACSTTRRQCPSCFSQRW